MLRTTGMIAFAFLVLAVSLTSAAPQGLIDLALEVERNGYGDLLAEVG